MTELHRLGGIIVSPAKTFEDINQRPTQVFPLALLLLSSLLGNFVVYQVLITDANFDQIARTKVQWDNTMAGSQEEPTNIDHQMDTFRRERKYWYLFPLIAVPASVLAFSFFFYLVLRLANAGAPFYKVVVVVCWAAVISRCIGGVFTITALLIRGAAHFFPGPSEAWSPTSLAQLISRSLLPPTIYSTLSKLDIFLVWWLAVLAIGFSKIAKDLSLAKSAVLVTASELLYLLIHASGLPR